MAQVSQQSAEVEKQQTAHEAELQQLLGAVGGLQALMQHACVTGGPLSHSPRSDAACLLDTKAIPGLRALMLRAFAQGPQVCLCHCKAGSASGVSKISRQLIWASVESSRWPGIFSAAQQLSAGDYGASLQEVKTGAQGPAALPNNTAGGQADSVA